MINYNWVSLNTDRYYNEINKIKNSRGQYAVLENFHQHHIIPKCKGGNGDRKDNSFRKMSSHENCLYVTKEEHYYLHQILYEDNPNDPQLAKAFLCISDNYNISREEFGEIHYKHSPETIKKLSDKKKGNLNPCFGKTPWNKGIKITPEVSKILSEKLSGVNNPNYGKARSDETKAKISKNSRGTKPNNKKVICVETGQVFYSIEEAIRITGYKKIRDVLHGRRKSTGGTHWRFTQDESSNKEKA